MKNKVSFEGIGEVMATFCAGEGVKVGGVVKVSGDSTVKGCAAGERFFGVACSGEKDYVGVQTKGFVQVRCADSTVTVGYVKLTADGNGGVKKAGAGSPQNGETPAVAADEGQEYWVVADDGAGTITIQM